MNTVDIPLPTIAAIVRQRMGLVLGSAVVLAVLAFAAASLLPGRYTAEAEILIEAGSGQPIPGRIESTLPPVDETAVLTEVTALGAHELLATARGQLTHNPVFNTPAPTADRPDVGASALAKRLRDWQHRARAAFNGALESLGLRHAPVSTIPAVPGMLELHNQLKVFQEAGSRVIAVNYTAVDPRVAAAVANTVANVYVQGRAERSRNDLDRALATVNAELPRLAASLEQQEAAAVAYQTTHGYLGEARAGVIEQKLTDLARQNVEAQSNLAASTARLANLRALMHGYRDWDAFLATQSAAQLIDLHHQLQGLLQSLSGQAVAITGQVDLAPTQTFGASPLRAKLRDEITLAMTGLSNDVAVAKSRAAAIAHQLASAQAASSDVRLQTMMDDIAATRHRLQQMRERRIALLDERDSLVPAARILSTAAIPDRPSSPSAFLFVPPAAILGALIGMFVAIMRTQSDRSIRTEHQIMSLLGLRCAGIVPEVAHGRRLRLHELMLDQPLGVYAEAIRTVLVAVEPGPRAKKMGRAIMVTSSLPEEGKTTLAVSLATCAAALGRRVLLLDLDFRHQAVAREIGHDKGDKAVTVLTREGAQVLTVESRGKPRFDYLSIGNMTEEPLQWLEPHRFGPFIQKLRAEYDQIVIDTAPLLAIADTSLVIPFVDRILFAIRWGSTNRDLVTSGAGLLHRGTKYSERSGVDMAAVLTRVNLRKHRRAGFGDRGDVLAAYARGGAD